MQVQQKVRISQHLTPTLLIASNLTSNYSIPPVGVLTYGYELGVEVYQKAGNHDPPPAAIDWPSRKSIVADL